MKLLIFFMILIIYFKLQLNRRRTRTGLRHFNILKYTDNVVMCSDPYLMLKVVRTF